jgi:hypothetical protein
MTAKIEIDGRTFAGSSVTIRDNRLSIDDIVQPGVLHGVIEVRIVEGSVLSVESDRTIFANDVQVASAGETLFCHDVTGSISAGGAVIVAGNVSGDIQALGPVLAHVQLPQTRAETP